MGLSSTHIQNGPGTTWILVSASSKSEGADNQSLKDHHPRI